VPEDFRATFVRILAYMGGLGILATFAAGVFGTPDLAAAVQPASRPEWITVDRPHPAFELAMPDMPVAPDYTILRRVADGGRKDILRWGDAGVSGPFAMVEVNRPGSAGERFIDAPSEIAARILSFTVTDDVKPAGQVDSKFGAVALVDFAIAARPDARPRRCLGFARAFDQPALQIAGWYCSPGEEVVSRATLACALDRLTMLSSGGDPGVASLFAGAELKRTFCGQRNPILAATPEREAPLAATSRNVKVSVALRGRLSQR
jgi:hypothetical protein